MPETKLLTRLRDLHEELTALNLDSGSTDSIDEATIEALGQLVTDANMLVDQVSGASDNKQIESRYQDLIDRINAFENRQPRVMAFLSQMTDFLAMIGI